jgi:hypothetical protein
MQVTYNNNSYKSLTEMAKNAPQTREFMESFREKSTGIIDHAIDTFFQIDREEAEGRAAVNDLMDLESALKACRLSKFDRDKENKTFIDSKLKNNDYPLEKGKTVEIENKEIDRYGYKITIGKGKEVSSDETVKLTGNSYNYDSMDNFTKLVNDLHQVLPLYTCVAMVPGPMSVTVKNMAKESLNASVSGGSFSTESSDSLFSSSYSRSGSSESGETKATKISADERIIPSLMDLKSRLEEMDITESKKDTLCAVTNVKTYETVEKRSFPIFGKKVKEDIFRDESSSSRPLENIEYESEHLSLPYHGAGQVSSHRDLKNRPLTELAEKSLNDKAALETFKEKGKEVIDHAIDVFFKTDREFKDGKQAVNELSDLQGALKTFTKKDKLHYSLGDMISKFHDALGLYTCVAMSPGPMSATVKSLPKISIKSHQEESSFSRGETKKLLSNSQFHSESYKESRFAYDITTTDERVIPTLMDVRSQIDQF